MVVVSNLSGGSVEESKSSQQQPCLLITDGENCRIQTNMFNNRPQLLYDVGGEIPEFLGRKIGSSWGEWLLLTGTGHDVLVNLFSKERIYLPSVDYRFHYSILTSHPHDPTCHIVYFSYEMAGVIFCQPGDKEFTIKKWDHYWPMGVCAVVAGKVFLSMKVHFGGAFKVGVIEFKESTYRFEEFEMDVLDDRIIPIPVPVRARWFKDSFYYFEYSGELFKVYKTRGGRHSLNVTGFEILKADLLNKKWVSVKNLGGVAIFLGSETAQVESASAESGITANTIYFLEEDDLDNYYIYNLVDGTIRMKPTFSSMETTKNTQVYWIMMHCDASFPKLLKDSEKENKSVEVEDVWVQNSWKTAPPELLNLIQLHLFGRDHAVFRVVCKSWQQVPIRDYSIPPLISSTTLVELCESSSPLLMFQEDMTISYESVPIFRFFDPVHRKLYRMGIPELRETDIHYSKYGWLLVCGRRDGSIFFFKPLTKEKIELPRNSLFHAFGYPITFSFSSPPTCSDCLIVGMNCMESLMFTHKLGEETWNRKEFDVGGMTSFGCRPIVLNEWHHFMADNGDMVVLNLKNGVERRKKSKLPRPDSLRGEDFFLEIDGALAFVSVGRDGGDINIYKWSSLEKDWELMKGVDFGGRVMFISERGSFMEKIDDVGAMGNTIFLPMIDDAKEGVFYSPATHKYHTFYSGYSSKVPYSVDKFLNGVWLNLSPDRNAPLTGTLPIDEDNNLNSEWFDRYFGSYDRYFGSYDFLLNANVGDRNPNALPPHSDRYFGNTANVGHRNPNALPSHRHRSFGKTANVGHRNPSALPSHRHRSFGKTFISIYVCILCVLIWLCICDDDLWS